MIAAIAGGAQALAVAVFLARRRADKSAIRDELEDRFGYDLHRHVAAIRPNYKFDVTCQASVPEAIGAFLDSDDVDRRSAWRSPSAATPTPSRA